MDIINILTILINVCLIFAVWRNHKAPCCFERALINNRIFWGQLEALEKNVKRYADRKVRKAEGERKGAVIKAKIAEKMAEKAFNMASAANLGVVALQRTLQLPRLMTKEQGIRNALANKEVNKLFDSEGSYDFLRPILSDEDLDILDEIEKKKLQDALTNGEM